MREERRSTRLWRRAARSVAWGRIFTGAGIEIYG
nr:MAG TPA: hypothetical protein [Caudoviricetes sp.]